MCVPGAHLEVCSHYTRTQGGFVQVHLAIGEVSGGEPELSLDAGEPQTEMRGLQGVNTEA